jgi:nucleotide-binding universal stress UspA family protein
MGEQRHSRDDARRILVGFDPRRADTTPVDFGVLCARLTGARLLVAAVGGERLPLFDGVDGDLVEDPSVALDELEVQLTQLLVPFTIVRLVGRSAAQALHEEAERSAAGLVVIGSSRRAVAGRVLVGGTAQRLLHGAPCPVAVVPAGWIVQGGVRTVAAAYVDTPEGRAALHAGHALARKAAARLRVITVLKVTPEMPLEAETYVAGRHGKSPESVEGERILEARRRLGRALSELGADVDADIDVFVGDPDADPAGHLVPVSEHVDVMVCGSRGYGPVRAVVLGSVSARLTAQAHCPVIVVPRGVDAPFEALLGAPARGRTAHTV